MSAASPPLASVSSLRLSNAARQERSIGAVVNHMSSDLEKVQQQTMSINNLWSAPIRLSLGLYILISSLGVSGIFGFVCVLLLLPVQTYTMKVFAQSVKEGKGKNDARIKLVNEILGGMRVIKYYAWEKPFQVRLQLVRPAENLMRLSIYNI